MVTALGIKRHDKSLGYSTQTVNSEEILRTQNNNWAQALEGKVAGLKIQTAGAGPLGTSRITLRGDISMNMGNNDALIVVDGVPLSGKKRVPERQLTVQVREVTFLLITETVSTASILMILNPSLSLKGLLRQRCTVHGVQEEPL